MDFQNIPKKYRPVPFWSWNERLDTAETARQIGVMDKAGLGGYFMHARGGLQTPYMGSAWFDNVQTGVTEGQKRGMGAWAYDENGWPSGFGGGLVNGKGLAYQQKYLRIEPGEKQTETTICNTGGYHLYYEVNPFYVDTLDGSVVADFISEIYEPYYERFGNSFEGFFTDEPQISRNGIPWSFILPAEYKAAYGEDLLPLLPLLFYAAGSYKQTRIRFWKLVTELFSKNFCKQIYDWCDARGLKLTGHLVCEETLLSQLVTNGACMPHYEYFHNPGVDKLSRTAPQTSLLAIQAASVANQLGKKCILTESFAMCGHNVSFGELKSVFEFQAVRGVNWLCPHLEGYSLRGLRKRDYPPAMYEQQPWWEHYPAFVNALSRIGMILREGAVQYDVLVLHPQTTAWALFDTVHNEPLEALQDALENIVRTLDEKHILFHLGDELIMERHARVEGNKLLIGQQAYTTVILPPHEVLLDRTKQLLAEFEAGGGRITTADALPENRVVDSPDIVYTVRHFDGADVYYFVNLTDQTIDASIAVGNKQIDLFTGAELPFDGRCTFAPHDSILVLADGGARAPVVRRTQKALDLSGMWKIKQADLNALTLDRCDYYFDGVCVEENGYVLNIQNRACDLGRPVQIECVYRVELRHLPETLYLVCETPERFEILVNGRPVDKTDCGFYRDRAFRKLNIAPLVCEGVNTITLRTDFSQSAAVYENIAKSKQFESEKNKLCYDMEIEPLYLLGDFAVETDGGFKPLENDGVRYTGGFAIAAPVREAALAHLEQHGYPFFCGSITFEKEFQLEDTDYKLKLAQHGYNAVVAEVNGAAFPPMLWGSFEADLSGHLRKGANTIRLTVVNNLRNLLGPHHLESGEPLGVGPGSFFMEPCVWNQHLQQKDVNPNYCFVQFGLL